MTLLRIALLMMACVCLAPAQVTRTIFAAGTPEDQALQKITADTDAATRIAQYQSFINDFAANPQAVAYASAELAQLYLKAGDTAVAMKHSDQAVAAAPNNLAILVTLAGLAQQVKDNARTLDYALKGALAFHGIARQAKPDDITQDVFDESVKREQEAARSAYEYLESLAFNAIAGEDDAARRMAYIEAYTPAFPASRYDIQVSQYAVYTLQQLKDSARLVSYGEKALQSNPDSVPTLVLLAETYAEDAKLKNLAKAVEYARRAVKAAEASENSGDASSRLLAGSAHSVLGTALLNQDKTQAAIAPLTRASTLLKENEAASSAVLYRLGFAYAKLRRYTEAREVLMRAVQVNGPARPLARELLVKVNAARVKGQ